MYLQFGDYFYEMGSFKLALIHYLISAELNPFESENYLGIIKMMKRNYKDIYKVLLNLEDLSRDYPSAVELKETIKELKKHMICS